MKSWQEKTKWDNKWTAHCDCYNLRLFLNISWTIMVSKHSQAKFNNVFPLPHAWQINDKLYGATVALDLLCLATQHIICRKKKENVPCFHTAQFPKYCAMIVSSWTESAMLSNVCSMVRRNKLGKQKFVTKEDIGKSVSGSHSVRLLCDSTAF